jgi:hypothetical protein
LLSHDGVGFFWIQRNARVGEQTATHKIFPKKYLFLASMIACELPNDASANIIRSNETHHINIIRSDEEKHDTPSLARVSRYKSATNPSGKKS